MCVILVPFGAVAGMAGLPFLDCSISGGCCIFVLGRWVEMFGFGVFSFVVVSGFFFVLLGGLGGCRVCYVNVLFFIFCYYCGFFFGFFFVVFVCF